MSVPENTVTPAEAPVNTDATEVPSNYLICDRTGFRVTRDEGLREEWNGLKVRKDSWEPRNAQDFVRGRSDSQEGSERPEQQDVFITLPCPP